MASDTGAKWILIIFVYFVILTTVTTLISFSFGGTFDSELGLSKVDQCMNPRLIYENFNEKPIYSTDQDTVTMLVESDLNLIRDIREVAHMDCRKSVGVVSEDICEQISGCSWEAPPSGIIEGFLRKFWNIWEVSEDVEKSCFGDINGSFYNIETKTNLFNQKPSVLAHENDDLGVNLGSVCTHPEVKSNSELCELFSCSWVTIDQITELEIEKLELRANLSTFQTALNTISDMFTLRFNWGFENPFVNSMAVLFTFYIPLLILIFAIYISVRS